MAQRAALLLAHPFSAIPAYAICVVCKNYFSRPTCGYIKSLTDDDATCIYVYYLEHSSVFILLPKLARNIESQLIEILKW